MGCIDQMGLMRKMGRKRQRERAEGRAWEMPRLGTDTHGALPLSIGPRTWDQTPQKALDSTSRCRPGWTLIVTSERIWLSALGGKTA